MVSPFMVQIVKTMKGEQGACSLNCSIMRILAADTSTMSGSLALLDGENLTAEWTLRSAQTHNRRLLKSIDSILREAGWDLDGVDALAVAKRSGKLYGSKDRNDHDESACMDHAQALCGRLHS